MLYPGNQRVGRGMGMAFEPIGGLRAGKGLRLIRAMGRGAACNRLTYPHMGRQRLQKGMMGALVTQNQ